MPYHTDIPGYMSLSDLKILERLAQKVPLQGSIIEIGSFMGRSSWTFAKSADPSVTVYCIDIWEGGEIIPEHAEAMANYQKGKNYDFAAFKEYVKDCPNIIPIQSRSTETKWSHEKKTDLIFIDASHESPDVDEDLDYWFPYLKKGGIFCGHDFDLNVFPDVCRAVITFSENHKLPIAFFKDSTIWMIERTLNVSLQPDILISTPDIIEQIRDYLGGKEKPFIL